MFRAFQLKLIESTVFAALLIVVAQKFWSRLAGKPLLKNNLGFLAWRMNPGAVAQMGA